MSPSAGLVPLKGAPLSVCKSYPEKNDKTQESPGWRRRRACWGHRDRWLSAAGGRVGRGWWKGTDSRGRAPGRGRAASASVGRASCAHASPRIRMSNHRAVRLTQGVCQLHPVKLGDRLEIMLAIKRGREQTGTGPERRTFLPVAAGRWVCPGQPFGLHVFETFHM